jgi:hypothetical protein
MCLHSSTVTFTQLDSLTFTQLDSLTFTQLDSFLLIYLHTHAHTHTHTHTHVCVYVCMYVCIYLPIYASTTISLSLSHCIYISSSPATCCAFTQKNFFYLIYFFYSLSLYIYKQLTCDVLRVYAKENSLRDPAGPWNYLAICTASKGVVAMLTGIYV